jgi:hypothetical protein
VFSVVFVTFDLAVHNKHLLDRKEAAMKSILLKTFSFLIIFVVIVTILFDLKTSEENDQEHLTCYRRPMEKDILMDNLMWQALETPIG